MVDIDISVDAGTSKRLLTAGKYCDKNILVTATGGGTDIPTPDASYANHILRVNNTGTDYELAAPDVAVNTHPYIDLGNFVASGADYISTIDYDVLASLGTANTVVKVTLPSVGSLYGVLSKIGTDYVSSLSVVSNGTVTVYALEIDETSASAHVYVHSVSGLPAVSSADAGKIPVVSDDGTGYELEEKPEGIPTGGTTGQVLTKDSDGNATWQSQSGGIVPVSELPTANEAEYNKHALYLYDGSLNYIVLKTNVVPGTPVETLSATLPSSRWYASAAAVGTDCYVFGGATSDGNSNQIVKFDTVSQTVTTLSVTLPSARYSTSAAAVGTDCYVFGGINDDGTTVRYDEIIKFGIVSQTVTTLSATLPSARYATSAAAVGTDCYVFGGNSNGLIDEIVKFDTVSQTVTTLSATLPSSRWYASAAAVGTDCYVFGGNSNGLIDEIVKFDTVSQTVTTLSVTLPSARQHSSAASVGTDCYVFGGYISGGKLNEIVKFDTVSQTVTTLSTTLPSARYATSAAAVGTDCYVFGGNSNGLIDEIVKFNPYAGYSSTEYSYKTLLNKGDTNYTETENSQGGTTVSDAIVVKYENDKQTAVIA